MRSWWPQQMVFTLRHLSRVNNWLGFFPILFNRAEKLVSICKQNDMYLYINRCSHNLLLCTSLLWSLCIEQLVFSTLKIKKLGNNSNKYLLIWCVYLLINLLVVDKLNCGIHWKTIINFFSRSYFVLLYVKKL